MDSRTIEDALTRLKDQAVDGAVIVVEAHLIDRDVLSPNWGFPIVVLDSSDNYELPVVDHDQAQGARTATEHLLGLGHHTEWHVGGPRAPTQRHPSVDPNGGTSRTRVDRERGVSGRAPRWSA
ncbi:hypothetical protein [Microbacterium sp. E-13]|uniref:hypothetical protein n=1 Tax=Microbacterium sp. E-13 TaxID=3404048 RepID=UPI003CEE20CA